jgi:RND superfamily putative drug exporter
LVIIIWIVLLLGLLGLSNAVGGEYNTDFKQPDSESARAVDLLQERGLNARTGFQGQIVFKAERGVNDPAVRRAMEEFFAKAEAALEDEPVPSAERPSDLAGRQGCLCGSESLRAR